MKSKYNKRSVWLVPKDFLTGRYLQLRIVTNTFIRAPKISIYNKEGELPFLITRFASYGGLKCYRSATIFINKSLLDKDVMLRLYGERVNTKSYLDPVSIFNDDTFEADKAYGRKRNLVAKY